MKKETLLTGFWFVFCCLTVYGLYIGMVLEPECERKGYAGADKKGCYIIKNSERTYEN